MTSAMDEINNVEKKTHKKTKTQASNSTFMVVVGSSQTRESAVRMSYSGISATTSNT